MNKSEIVEETIGTNEEKLELLREWQKCMEKAISLSDTQDWVASDTIDDRCIEIEEHFESEYGIEFDSYGTVNKTVKDKGETVSELIEHITEKLEYLKEWQENEEALQELADGGCLDEDDGFDEIFENIEETLAVKFDINLH